MRILLKCPVFLKDVNKKLSCYNSQNNQGWQTTTELIKLFQKKFLHSLDINFRQFITVERE